MGTRAEAAAISFPEEGELVFGHLGLGAGRHLKRTRSVGIVGHAPTLTASHPRTRREVEQLERGLPVIPPRQSLREARRLKSHRARPDAKRRTCALVAKRCVRPDAITV